MSRFQRATRKSAKARIALVGPSGSGKTYTALVMASRLGQRVAVIDTEHGSADKYADLFAFDSAPLTNHDPREYVKALGDAAREGYDVVLIDSLSHAWNGTNGALELVDKAGARKGGNKFAAWADVTPLHNQLVNAILGYPGHVVVTMRAKTEWVLEEDSRGKKTPKKVGLAPVQRDGMEYEFDLVAEIDVEHTMVVTKSRCVELADAVIKKPGAEVGDALARWLGTGEAPAAAATPTTERREAPATREQPTSTASPEGPEPSRLELAVSDLDLVEDDRAFVDWFVRNMQLLAGLKGDEKKATWKAITERGTRLQLGERDLRPLFDEAQTILSKRKAA